MNRYIEFIKTLKRGDIVTCEFYGGTKGHLGASLKYCLRTNEIHASISARSPNGNWR